MPFSGKFILGDASFFGMVGKRREEKGRGGKRRGGKGIKPSIQNGKTTFRGDQSLMGEILVLKT